MKNKEIVERDLKEIEHLINRRKENCWEVLRLREIIKFIEDNL